MILCDVCALDLEHYEIDRASDLLDALVEENELKTLEEQEVAIYVALRQAFEAGASTYAAMTQRDVRRSTRTSSRNRRELERPDALHDRPRNGPQEGTCRYSVVPTDKPHLRPDLDYCVAPDARVLTTDLRWVEVGGVCRDEELIGFDENPQRSSKLRRTLVESATRVVRAGYRIKLEDGSTIVASGHHLWISTGTSQGPRSTPHVFGRGAIEYIYAEKRKWVRTRELVPGVSRISRWLEPWQQPQGDQEVRDAAWLGGLLDGEGWLFETCVGFGQNEGRVYEEFRRVCDALGLQRGPEYRSLKSNVIRTYLRGNQNSLKALSLGLPVRLLPRAHEIWEGRQTYGSHLSTAPLVVALEPLGDLEMITLQTSTRTFVAEGFLCHDSQMEVRNRAPLSNDATG